MTIKFNVEAGFNAAKCRELRDIMQAALDQAGVEGVSFNIGNAKFDQDEVTFSVDVSRVGVKTRAQRDLELMANTIGIDVNRQAYMNSGKQRFLVELTEYKSRKRKMPWIVSQVGNPKNQWQLTDAQVKEVFA